MCNLISKAYIEHDIYIPFAHRPPPPHQPRVGANWVLFVWRRRRREKAILNYCIYLSRLTKNAAAFVVRNGEFVRTMQYNVLYNAHCARMSDVPPDVYAVKYRLGFSQYARNHSHI